MSVGKTEEDEKLYKIYNNAWKLARLKSAAFLFKLIDHDHDHEL
jgi:hypothetical protein